MRGGANPCALPIESSFGPFWGVGEGQENIGGNRAEGLPAWFRLLSASPGGGFGSCSHRDVACEPRRTADFRQSPRRGAPHPCALPIESASGPFGGFGEGQENLGGNGADGLPAWFRLPSASPGGGFGSCSHRDVACEPRRTADLVTVPLLLLRVRLPLSGLLWRWTMPTPDRSSWVWHRPCQSAMRRSPYPSGPRPSEKATLAGRNAFQRI